MEQRALIGTECPRCHQRQFMEVEIDDLLLKSPLYDEVRKHLEGWIGSQCPDHLHLLEGLSKN